MIKHIARSTPLVILLYHPRPFGPTGKYPKNVAHAQQLGGGTVAQHSGERRAGRYQRTIRPKETEPGGRAIRQRAELLLGVPECLLYPPTSRHHLPQVGDLLPERHDPR